MRESENVWIAADDINSVYSTSNLAPPPLFKAPLWNCPVFDFSIYGQKTHMVYHNDKYTYSSFCMIINFYTTAVRLP